jgi:hypothetical protein
MRTTRVRERDTAKEADGMGAGFGKEAGTDNIEQSPLRIGFGRWEKTLQIKWTA